MPQAWRIVKERHATSAFSGDGAAKTGGRWNSRGVPVVYASSTRALAALEILVHLNPPVAFNFCAFSMQFDRELVEKISRNQLPEDWRIEPPGPSTKIIGDLWVGEARSAVLELPSVIIPGESNYLFNPAHPGFRRVSIGKPEGFTIDPRLLA